MSTWNELLDKLSSDDDDLTEDRLADLWILLSARIEDVALVALADVGITVRAIYHITAPSDHRLSEASRLFLLHLLEQSSEQDIESWVYANQRELIAKGKSAEVYEAAFEQLRKLLLETPEANYHHHVMMSHGSGKSHFLAQLVANRLSPDETLTAAAELASLHPELEREEPSSLRSLLATIAVRDQLSEEFAGGPREVLSADDVADSLLRQARIAGEAKASVWEYPMLEARAAAVALGVKPGNREKVRVYRERSWLLGLPKGKGFVYPTFQFDPDTQDVYAEVRRVNELLGASADPWGTASWWITRNDRLGSRPVELVGAGKDTELMRAAQSLLERVG